MFLEILTKAQNFFSSLATTPASFSKPKQPLNSELFSSLASRFFQATIDRDFLNNGCTPMDELKEKSIQKNEEDSARLETISEWMRQQKIGKLSEEPRLIVPQDACTDGMQKEQLSTNCIESEGEDLEGETSVDSRRNSISADEEPWIQNFFAEDNLSDSEQLSIEENPFTHMDSTLFNELGSEVVLKDHKDHDDLESLRSSLSDLDYNWSIPDQNDPVGLDELAQLQFAASKIVKEEDNLDLEGLKASLSDLDEDRLIQNPEGFNELAGLQSAASNLSLEWLSTEDSSNRDEEATLSAPLSNTDDSFSLNDTVETQRKVSSSRKKEWSQEDMIESLRALYTSPTCILSEVKEIKSLPSAETKITDTVTTIDIDEELPLSSELPKAPKALYPRIESSVGELKPSSTRAAIVFAKEGEELSDEQKEINELISSMRAKRSYGRSLTTDNIPSSKPIVQTRPRSNSAPDVLVRH